jgi:hypothetical protein
VQIAPVEESSPFMSKRIVVLSEELEDIRIKLNSILDHLETPLRHVDDPIFDTEGVMKLLNVSRRSLQSWRDDGTIEFSAIRGKFFYRLSAIENMLQQNLRLRDP